MRSMACALALSGALGWVACGGSAQIGGNSGTTGAGGAPSGSGGATSSGSTSVATAASSSSSSGGGGPSCTPTCSGHGCCMLVKHFGDANGQAYGQAIAADPVTGDILVGGSYTGSLDLGMGPLPSVTPGPELSGAFLARYDTNGAPIWTKGWAAPGISINQIVPVGTNIVVAGDHLGDLASGCGAAAGGGVAVVELAGDGTCIWLHAMSGYVSAVAVDAHQDLVVAGQPSTSVLPDFGCGPETTMGSEGFVAKLRGSDGVCVWSHLFPAGVALAPRAGLAVDASSAVYVGSAFLGTLGFGGQTLMSVSMNGDALLLKYDEQGNEVWARSWGSTTFPWTESWVDGIAVTKDQRVWITGAYDQGVTFGSQAFGEAPWSGFVAGVTPDGDLVTAVSLTSGAQTVLNEGAMLVGSAGALVTVRRDEPNSGGCSVTIGSGVVTGCGTLLTTLDPAAGLALSWARALGTSLGSDGLSAFTGMPLALDGCDDILVTGGFSQTTDWGCGPMTSLGNTDVFFARLAR